MMDYSRMTRGEKLAYVQEVIAPYKEKYLPSYVRDVMRILKERGLKNALTGKPYTAEQIRHTKSGRLPHPELANVLAEVGRRNKEVMAKVKKTKKETV